MSIVAGSTQLLYVCMCVCVCVSVCIVNTYDITHTKYQRCRVCAVLAAGDHHAFVERAPDDDAETKNIYNFIYCSVA
jgi:hypothetical protein